MKSCQNNFTPESLAANQQYEADLRAEIQQQQESMEKEIWGAPTILQRPAPRTTCPDSNLSEDQPSKLLKNTGHQRAQKEKEIENENKVLADESTPSSSSYNHHLFNATQPSFMPLSRNNINTHQDPSSSDPGSPQSSSPSLSSPPTRPPRNDDIRTTYHPSTGKPERIDSFSDYGRESAPFPPHHPKPWLPFHSESEFSFASIVHEAAMSQLQVDALVKVVHKLLKDRNEHFLVKDARHMAQLWTDAAQQYAPFTKTEIEVPYNKEVHKFEFWSRSLKEWSRTVLEDKYLGKIAAFDACFLEKYDEANSEWVRFIDGPTSADRLWEVQSQLPSDGRPLMITLYSDKTQVATFNNTSCHPIMAQIQNLPANIVNSNGLGGAQVVGWIPVIFNPEQFYDDPKERGKPEYVNFKRAVFHACYKHLLSTIEDASHVGEVYDCGGQKRVLYPLIYVLAADFEEQSDFALTKGAKSKFPCVRCLIPNEELSDLSKTWPSRDADATKDIYDKYFTSNAKKTEREKDLRAQGLRPVENAFYNVRFSHPFDSLTFDELHNNDHGLGGKHLFAEIKRQVDTKPASAKRLAESSISQHIAPNRSILRLASFPRWPRFNHFTKPFLSIDFTDGNTSRDMMKVIFQVDLIYVTNLNGQMVIYASHSVLATSEDPLGYRLLVLVRKYLNMVMWEMLEVHTEQTIKKGREAVQEFGRYFNAYDSVLVEVVPGRSLLADDDPKHGNHEYVGGGDDDDSGGVLLEVQLSTGLRTEGFPKFHNQKHAYRDIVAKGPLILYSTRPFEGKHKGLKKWHHKSNHKDVAAQVLTDELIQMMIDDKRIQILFAKQAEERWSRGETEFDGNFDPEFDDFYLDDYTDPKSFGNIFLGSPDKPTSFNEITSTCRSDPAFAKFPERTLAILCDLLWREDSNIEMTLDARSFRAEMKAAPNDKMVTCYKFIKATYESLVDWRAHTDLLRANPKWHQEGRFDTVIYDAGSQMKFGRLVRVFTIKLAARFHSGDGDKFVPLALIQPFSAVKPSKKDEDLHLIRLRETALSEATVIPARSIIRRSYIVPEAPGSKTFFAVDVIDSDMFLRLQKDYPL
ncbi:hypothetical protein H0H93_010132 [Arthromyces matolae]|nr:hypothetical protein H0H93_010132 [Arthromyces matolae]